MCSVCVCACACVCVAAGGSVRKCLLTLDRASQSKAGTPSLSL
uniref:Uncharacterized protein n=1 Tax=Anguilla anguilla TaxID=7936 RepID=A0A0E9UN23_ANGAN